MSGTTTPAGPAAAARTDRGHLAMVLVIALFCLWYLVDAARASATVDNLLLIAPTALLGLVLCLVLAVAELRKGRAGEAGSAPAGSSLALRRTIAFMGLMALYVAGLTWGPFDLATAIFIAAALFALGERRWWFILVISVVTTVVLLACLAALVPGSLPMLLPL